MSTPMGPPRETAGPKRSFVDTMLDRLERIGNALPNPATLFLIMAGLVVVASVITSALGVTVPHPKDGSPIVPVNLLTREGLRRMFTEATRNFTSFAPLGTVLVAMIGIGVAEATGLVAAALKGFVNAMPRALLTATIVFTGVNANQAADAGVIVLPPLGAMLFAAAGRHPLAGLSAAFAGVAGGFSANLLPSTLDVLLIGFTQEAVDASRLLPGYQAHVLGNYWFMMAATPILTVVGTWVTDRVIEPRLGPWKGGAADTSIDALTPLERRGLRAAMVATLLTAAGFFALTLPGGPLRGEGKDLLEQLDPFFDSMVTLVMLFFLVPGLVYGLVTRKIRNDHDVMKMTTDTIATMAGYIVLAFCAAQFVNYFAWSNLGSIVAVSGAGLLKSVGLEGSALLTALVLFSALLNLLITSSSALWAIVSPVLVPMFALMGFTPEATQGVFRVGESATNIITPLMPYMPFVLTAAQRYVPSAGMGTIITLMMPFAVVFLVAWTLLLLVFFWLGWDIGPGVPLRLH